MNRHESGRSGRLSVRLLLLGIVGAVASCAEPEVHAEPPIPSVKTFTVGKRASGQSRRISGVVAAAERSALSFGVAGQVVEVIAEQGDAVAEGQLLARLDAEPLQLALDQARARVTGARAKLIEARAAYDRTAGLKEQQAASQRDLDAATAALATADGELKSAESALEKAELDLGRTNLTAPFAGQIVAVDVDPFQEIVAGTEVMSLQSAGVFNVEVLVPETLIREVDHGQLVRVAFPTLEGAVLEGVVQTIGVEASSGNAYPVEVRLAPTDEDIRPGMTAAVTFNFSAYLDGRSAFLVPLSALAIDAALANGRTPGEDSKRDEAPLFVLDPVAERVEFRMVRVGDLRGNEIEVFEGLEAGELVVSAGVSFLRDGLEARAWVPRK